MDLNGGNCGGWQVSGRRGYVPKIFIRHDVMRSILTRFLDSKGVPKDAIETVLALKHYYAFDKARFEHFERALVWFGTIGLHDGQDIGNVLKRFPDILWIDINLLESKMQWFLSELRFQRHEIGPMLARNPNLLFHHAEILGSFLQTLESIGMRRTQIHDLIKTDAQMLEYCENVEELQSLVRWWTATLQRNVIQCSSMIRRVPALLNPVHHEHLPELYEYLYRMGVPTTAVGKMFSENPSCMIRDVAATKYTLQGIKKRFQIPQRQFAKVLKETPQLLSLELSAIDETAAFLTDVVGLSRQQKCLFVQTNPSVLLLDIPEALWPRFFFLTEVVLIPHEEILDFPECLMFKLDFMMQRFGFFKRAAKRPHKLHLQTMLELSNNEFAKSLNQSPARYHQFLEWWRVPSQWKEALQEMPPQSKADSEGCSSKADSEGRSSKEPL